MQEAEVAKLKDFPRSQTFNPLQSFATAIFRTVVQQLSNVCDRKTSCYASSNGRLLAIKAHSLLQWLEINSSDALVQRLDDQKTAFVTRIAALVNCATVLIPWTVKYFSVLFSLFGCVQSPDMGKTWRHCERVVHLFVEQRRVLSPYERFRLGLVELGLVMALRLVLLAGSFKV